MNYLNKDCVNKKYLKQAFKDSIKKLTFKTQIKKPVMFVVYIGCIITTILSFLLFLEIIKDNPYFILTITIFLWSTVVFENFAESIAESRGKSQATHQAKLELIHEHQRKGYLVAMAGDGNNDAPALAQADVSRYLSSTK